MFDGEIVKKEYSSKKILCQISSAPFLFVSDLSMLIITKLSIQTAITQSPMIDFLREKHTLAWRQISVISLTLSILDKNRFLHIQSNLNFNGARYNGACYTVHFNADGTLRCTV